MRILILGGNGMIGHQLFKHLSARHETRTTLRRSLGYYADFGIFTKANAYADVDIRSSDRLASILTEFKPQAVINGIGIVKQRPAAAETIPCLEINALFPHRLAALCREAGARLIHLTTDCVFSGKKGRYIESDISDAEDLYGRTKFLGEVQESHCLTLRTSSIGPELAQRQGLFEWFMSQAGSIKGFTKAIYSGFTTIEMGRIIERALVSYPTNNGLYHASSEPISKFDLLVLLREKSGKQIDIQPEDTFACDRSLDSTRFRADFDYTPPNWDSMAEELVQETARSRG